MRNPGKPTSLAKEWRRKLPQMDVPSSYFGPRWVGPFYYLEVEPCDQSHEEAAIGNLVNEETAPGDTNSEDPVLPPMEDNQVTSCFAIMEVDSQGVSDLKSPPQSPSMGFKSHGHSFANQTNKKMSNNKKKNRRSRP
ncbi:hypothetical protein U1Q18_003479 [Sarracenia purpurea var. burkii]